MEGETGYLIPFDESSHLVDQSVEQAVETAVESVAEKIAFLAQSPDVVGQLGQAGRERALANFSADSLAAALQRVYQPWL
ncbi:hypothetical protein P4544_13880 [Halomonas sp. LY9]